MHTFQIADRVIDGYRTTTLTDERINFLKAQVAEQLSEIREDEAVYKEFLEMVDAPENVDDIILWMLFMSNEDIVEAYIDTCNKTKFREIIPVSDLADLLIYMIHKKKLENSDTLGLDFLLENETSGIEEFDQYAFTNVLLYVEKSKQPAIEF